MVFPDGLVAGEKKPRGVSPPFFPKAVGVVFGKFETKGISPVRTLVETPSLIFRQ